VRNLSISKIAAIAAGGFVIGNFISGVYLNKLKNEYNHQLGKLDDTRKMLDELIESTKNGK
jgi:5-methylthioribose kinase